MISNTEISSIKNVLEHTNVIDSVKKIHTKRGGGNLEIQLLINHNLRDKKENTPQGTVRRYLLPLRTPLQINMSSMMREKERKDRIYSRNKDKGSKGSNEL